MQTAKSLAFAELTAYVYTNEAVLILEDVREGKSVAGAIMVIDRGRREEANRMRLELGNDVFMEFIESWADHYYEELAEIKKSIPSKDEATKDEAPKHVIGRRGCKNCGMPNGADVDCKPVQEALPSVELKLRDHSTDKLRSMANSMSSGTMADEQKSVLMKIEEELAWRAKEDMKWLEHKNVTLAKIGRFLKDIMQGKNNSQELDAYDFERHSLAVAKYAKMIPVYID